MQSQRAPSGHRKSAFAAAVFSFLFPGLGQVYLGLWSRALAWAALPILTIALFAGMLANPGSRRSLEGWAFDTNMLLGALVFLVVDLVYRLACVLDAYRLARRSGSASAGLGVLSLAGLVSVLAVLVVSHVAIARPVIIARDSLGDIFGGVTDEPVESFAPGVDASFMVPFTQAPSPTPDPSATPAPPTPTPEPTPTQGPSWDKGGRLNILLIGADAGRAGYTNYLTDTMIVVTIDPVTKQTAFITLPRDTTGLPIPRDWPAYGAWGGRFGTKANSIYTYAARLTPNQYPGPAKNKGFNAMKGILGETLGLKIDYFLAVDLKSFREIINDLGGVVIDVQNPVYDSHYAADDGSGHWKLYIPPGIQYMRGQEALAYSRARHETSDFDRSARQQRVITSVRKQLDLSSLLAPGVIQDLLKTFRSSIKTDIPPDKLPALIQLAQEIDLDKRISLALDPPDYSTVCYPCPPSGLYEIKANVPKMRKDVASIFKKSRGEFDRAAEMKGEAAEVHVLNGTRGNNLKSTRISDYLDSMGVNAAVPPINGGAAESKDYTETVITVYNGAEAAMPATIAFLEKTFKVTAVTATDEAQEADIVIVVGSETPALRP
jgi:LCP family protein required for cell wall assembly